MFGKKFLVPVLAFCALLAGCSSPVRGMAQPENGVTTPTTTAATTTTAPSSSAAPTTTTTAPTSTTSVEPSVPVDVTWNGAELSAYTAVLVAPGPKVLPITDPPNNVPDVKGATLRYTGIGAALVDVTLVAETNGNPAYQAWRASAIQDGTYDPRACDITNGFCSGGSSSPTDKGQPHNPDTVTLAVAGVKNAGTVTVRIQLVGDAKPINATRALNQLAVLVRDRLPR